MWPLRRPALCAAVAVGLAPAAAGTEGRAALAHDEHNVWGTVGDRVPGRNAASVRVQWGFRCLAETDGATYAWTLRLRRILPAPERVTTLAAGTSRAGSMGLALPPGLYEAFADPFRCETALGGSSAREPGEQFVVKDACAFTVYAVRTATVARGRARKRLAEGAVVRPGDRLLARRGVVTLLRDANALTIGTGGRVTLERGVCAVADGWQVRLTAGALRASVGRAHARGTQVIGTANARTSAGAAVWSVATGVTKRSQWTRVRVDSGVVRVHAAGRPPVRVAAGREAVVRGSGRSARISVRAR